MTPDRPDETAAGARRGARIGRLSRIGAGLQLIITIALALAAVLLVNWLAARPGIRQRFDLTESSRNTLSTAAVGLLERLDRDVRLEILWRPEPGPLQLIEYEVIQRTVGLAQLFEESAKGRITVEQVDTSDVEGFKEKQRRLRLRGFENGVIVVSGDRVTFLRLRGDLAQIDPGQPAANGYVPPAIAAFTAERALVEGILDVTRGERSVALFTQGAGEPGIEDPTTEREIGRFASELEAEGFELRTWNHATDGPIPEDAQVLVIAAPKQPWPDGMYEEIVGWVERGGRLLLAPSFDPKDLRASDVPDLFEHFDLTVSEGRVARYHQDPRSGQLIDGVEQCELHVIPPRGPFLAMHAITAPFFEQNLVQQFGYMHEVGVRVQPPDGVALEIVQTVDGWLDAAPPDRRYERGVDTTKAQGEGYGLAVTLRRSPMQEVPQPAGLEAIPEIRIVAFGSDSVLWNQNEYDLIAVPSVNWLADRQHRINVPMRDPDVRMLPRDDPEAIGFVARFAQIWFPAGVLLLGALVWIVRSRGTRRVAPEPKGPAIAHGPRP